MFDIDEILMLWDLVSIRKEEIKNYEEIDEFDKKEIVSLEKLEEKLQKLYREV